MTDHRTISEDEWTDEFLPTTDYPIEHDEIPAGTPPEKVWTFVAGDEGYGMIASGRHLVNRMGYYVTNIPHNFDVDVDLDL